VDLVLQHHEFVSQFLYQYGVEEIPVLPETDRPVEELFEDSNVWGMSLPERKTLYDAWYMIASDSIRQSQVEDFENLRRKHTEALKQFQEIQDQVNTLALLQAVGQ
jgi:hypothetical protein